MLIEDDSIDFRNGAWNRVRAFVEEYVPAGEQREQILDRLMPFNPYFASLAPSEWHEVRAQLEQLQHALKGLGKPARSILVSALWRELKSTDIDMKVPPKDMLRIITTVGGTAVTVANRNVKRGRPPAKGKRNLADQIAAVYLELTGKAPPTTQVIANDPGNSPYHRLAHDVFMAAGLLDGWTYNARQAALRLSQHAVALSGKSARKGHN